MAKAATERSEPTPLSGRLPEEIVIWEILVRLPPKNLVRCRAVCRAWRRITSTRHFLLAHHGHQPSLPLLSSFEYGVDCHQDIIPFDHRAATAQIQPLARLIDPKLRAVASCDGLLVMSIDEYDRTHFFVCNPVTRQWGDLPILRGFHFSGIYPHHPAGQYRLLLYRSQICKVMYEGKVPGDKDSWYVLTLGCDEVPRCIGWPEVEPQHSTPVLVRGSLHWYPAKHQTRSKMILAFDTASESFRLIRAPLLPESAYRFETHGSYLFEMDGMLAMYMHNDAVTVVDIWVLHDYDSEAWSRKYHVKLPKLPVAEIGGLESRQATVIRDGRDVFVLYSSGQALFLVDTKGTLLASSQLDGCTIFLFTQRIKESLVRHSFFSVLQGASDDCSSIISWPEGGV